jgi:thymidylate synthase
MKQYLDLLYDLLENGEEKHNDRTGEKTLFMPGCHLRIDLRESFPAVTTKKLAFKSAVGELIGFLRGATSAADFRALGCKVWDQNANENAAWLANPYREGTDHLGPVYGAQWRSWPAYKAVDPEASSAEAVHKHLIELGWRRVADNDGMGPAKGEALQIWHKQIDQLGDCVRKIILTPTDRRILFHGWNPATLDEVALPACHLLYQFLPNPTTKNLAMSLYIRSWDVALGGPINIASAALLLHIVAHLTGYTPTILNIFGGDVHLYEDHLPAVREQLTRDPLPGPQLNIKAWTESAPQGLLSWAGNKTLRRASDAGTDDELDPYVRASMADFAVVELAALKPEWIELVGYQHHGPLPLRMAV